MIGALNSSLSGLVSAATRVDAAASNIVNVNSFGTPEPVAQAAVLTGGRPATPPLRAYKPLRAVSTTTQDGGVQTTTQQANPATTREYQPDSPAADEKGYVDRPNVNVEANLVELKAAKQAYKANAAVIKAEDEMFGRLLDIRK